MFNRKVALSARFLASLEKEGNSERVSPSVACAACRQGRIVGVELINGEKYYFVQWRKIARKKLVTEDGLQKEKIVHVTPRAYYKEWEIEFI